MLTAVEWLMEINIKQNGIITAADYHTAKEMEKQQILDAYKHGQNNGYMYGDGNSNIIPSEQYYNETFNK